MNSVKAGDCSVVSTRTEHFNEDHAYQVDFVPIIGLLLDLPHPHEFNAMSTRDHMGGIGNR